MATIRIHEDEAYPDYLLDHDHERGGVLLDVPDDIADRWRAARTAWDQACGEINAAYRAIVYADQPPYRDTPAPYPGRQA